jgi:hypothetical protein
VISVLMNADLRAVHALVDLRQERVRHTNLLVSEHTSRNVVRRWIGRGLVRLGAWIAAEPAMRPARAR